VIDMLVSGLIDGTFNAAEASGAARCDDLLSEFSNDLPELRSAVLGRQCRVGIGRSGIEAQSTLNSCSSA
jgi:hypothetical protein